MMVLRPRIMAPPLPPSMRSHVTGAFCIIALGFP
jgi:hypothetical protein